MRSDEPDPTLQDLKRLARAVGADGREPQVALHATTRLDSYEVRPTAFGVSHAAALGPACDEHSK